MKTVVQGAVLAVDVGDEVFSALAGAAPDFVNGRIISVSHDLDDPRVQALIEVCRHRGLVVWGLRDPAHANRRTHLSLRLLRRHEPHELAECPYVELVPTKFIQECRERSPFDGVLSAFPQVLPRDTKLASPFVDSCRLVVPSATRAALEAERFAGIAFRPIRLVKKSSKSNRSSEAVDEIPWLKRSPWWELTGSIELPPVAPGLVVFCGNEPVPRGCTTHRSNFRDADYDDYELRFFDAEIQALPEFDFALTRERSGGPLARYYICSQRMYQFGVAQGWECRWRPVRLIPGP